MAQPLVYISIVNWNGAAHTERCLRSLFAMQHANHRIVVTDNGSTDDSLARLDGYADRITLFRNDRNAGYAGGNNRAMRHALAHGADYVWLLNSDATVQPQALGTLLAAAEACADIGLLSPALHYLTAPETIWNCGAIWDVERAESTPLTDPAAARRRQAEEPERLVLFGTALLARCALLRKIGLLDEDFFAYYEDIDYSIRSIDAGFRNVVVTQAVVYHDKSPDALDDRARPHFHYYMTRNRFLLLRKHAAPWRGAKGKFWYAQVVLRHIELLDGGAGITDACLAALWHAWLGVGGGFDPSRRMPWPLRAILGWRPGMWRRLLNALGAAFAWRPGRISIHR